MSISAEILHEIVLADKLCIVWSRKPSGTAVIFLLNRYMFGIYLILNAVFVIPGSVSDESCSTLDFIGSSLKAITLFTTNRQSNLRLVVSSDNPRSKTITAVAGRSTTGTQFGAFSMCGEILLSKQHIVRSDVRYRSSVAVVAISLVLDTLVFAITLIKTYRHFLEMRRHNQSSLTGLLLRDGTLYFFVVFTIAAANFALGLTSVLNVSETQTLLSELLQSYLAVLYLNLRAMSRQNDTVTYKYNGMPEPAFAQNRFLGNIGAPLDPDWWNTQFDDDEGDDDELTDQNGSVTPTVNNGVTTLVPVVYEGEGHGDIEMIPIHRESQIPIVGPPRSINVVA
ncbi:uncharacterized protein STEHIDRAFT_136359 [Stereum hirsutum FP-91666 SS1]|uniref:uncharacterized protein n=1 Tax=Stereum hirsutum (strain FP-91666) TaxID=721885 RepID=UPI000440E7E6|nr:uncharacterized protein STEHIDRAFT_136359 [Stereum hirsutum FP-91666 SS1]EIM92494.1 hypothetical protein STEHIDRAFT_136359 [Stereum hirsutum FP-91666 SS1]